MSFDERFWVTMVVVGCAFVFDVLVFLVPSKLDARVLDVLLTALNINGFVVAVQFWLGSSKSSSDKDATIHQLTKG